jgi:hypothetical protein
MKKDRVHAWFDQAELVVVRSFVLLSTLVTLLRVLGIDVYELVRSLVARI